MSGQERLCVLFFVSTMTAQEPTCRLEGQVVDSRTEPVAGATLFAECNGKVVGRTQSDAAGMFVFGHLPQDYVLVRATTPAPDVAAAWIDLLGEPRTFLPLVTMPARAVTGSVRDDAGQPVAGAWIVTAPYDAGDLGLASCTAVSDASGRFRLTHVPFGRNVLRAWAPGHDAFEATVNDTGDVTLDCRIERDATQERTFVLIGATAAQCAAARLDVSVLHAGCPLPLPPAMRNPPLGADGLWCLRGWPYADEMRASIAGSDLAFTPTEHTVPADVPARRREFELATGDAARIKGRLVGVGALGGVTLVAQPITKDLQPRRVLTRTLDDGTFELPALVATGESFALRLLSREHVVQTRENARAWFVASHTPSTLHAVAIAKAHHVRLRVIGGTGRPIAGARISILGRCRPPRVLTVVGIEDMPTWRIASGITDAEGTEEITGLELLTDEQLLCAVTSPEGYEVRSFQVAAGATTDLGDLTLVPTASVRVVVTDPAGQPWPGARVQIQTYGAFDWRVRHVAADRTGEILVRGLEPGMHGFRLLSETEDQQQVPLPADVITTVTLRENGDH